MPQTVWLPETVLGVAWQCWAFLGSRLWCEGLLLVRVYAGEASHLPEMITAAFIYSMVSYTCTLIAAASGTGVWGPVARIVLAGNVEIQQPSHWAEPQAVC